MVSSVRTVPSLGSLTARCAANDPSLRPDTASCENVNCPSGAPISTASARPTRICDMMTPELPRALATAPSAMARVTATTSASTGRAVTTSAADRMVNSMLLPVSESGIGKTLRSLISPRSSSSRATHSCAQSRRTCGFITRTSPPSVDMGPPSPRGLTRVSTPSKIHVVEKCHDTCCPGCVRDYSESPTRSPSAGPAHSPQAPRQITPGPDLVVTHPDGYPCRVALPLPWMTLRFRE